MFCDAMLNCYTAVPCYVQLRPAVPCNAAQRPAMP
ncbi:hypothetical protein FQN60_000301 [Etheostoma spectabile]|uniref:Uncharacterized protein n=1 Tax=Etheostoma spectabile TaxID=54343 RepID=A0A5J5D1Q2_9PERO|nr:hypothetical protein FQN60_000301 [Etheostoma spectabile]